jgi:hypothetical protein
VCGRIGRKNERWLLKSTFHVVAMVASWPSLLVAPCSSPRVKIHSLLSALFAIVAMDVTN